MCLQVTPQVLTLITVIVFTINSIPIPMRLTTIRNQNKDYTTNKNPTNMKSVGLSPQHLRL